MSEECFCSTCVYWLQEDRISGAPVGEADLIIGECRRHAPSTDIDRSGARVKWPRTASDDFCGEFVDKDSQADVSGPVHFAHGEDVRLSIYVDGDVIAEKIKAAQGGAQFKDTFVPGDDVG